MTQTASPAGNTSPSPPPPPLLPRWHVGHAVTSPKRCCTAYRGRYVVYAATDASIAIVDVTAQRPTSITAEAAWRDAMRVVPLSSADEVISFVCGHPERDVLCVGTRQHGLYITSLSQPTLTASAKLPRSVTGDVTYGAAFLFTEEANYLAFSSLLLSRPSEPAPCRLSLWCLDTAVLLWRGAMAPLESMCAFPFDLSFAACEGGRVCLFTVQSSSSHGADASEGPSPPPAPAAAAAAAGPGDGGRPQGERQRLVVLSRLCGTVDELREAHYTCCLASPAAGEDTYLALTNQGFLVALHATSGSVTRWMDCKVPAAAGLCLFADRSLVLTGELTRLFEVDSWEFQGKIKSEPSTTRALARHDAAETLDDVFTSAVAADRNTLLLFYRSGAVSFHSVEAKTGTHRLGLHRSCLLPAPLKGGGSSGAEAAEWLQVSSSLWCWWTPHALMFVTAPGGSLVAVFAVHSSCIALHPASGVVVFYDVRRRALVAYGRTATAPMAEVGVLSYASAAAAADGGSTSGSSAESLECVTSLACSAAGESLYALVSVPDGAVVSPSLPPRLRRFRCGWGAVPAGEAAERGFYLEAMPLADGSSSGGAAAASTLALPAGTHALLVHADGASAEAGDRVVAVQHRSLTAVDLSDARERPAAQVFTHAEPLQRVVSCRGGLLLTSASGCSFLQWRPTTASAWTPRPLLRLPAAAAASQAEQPARRAAPPLCVAVAFRRPDVAVLCADRSVAVWQVGEAPRLLTTGSLRVAPSYLAADVEEATRRVQLWALDAAGVDAYQLAPVELVAAPAAVLTSPLTPIKEMPTPPARAALAATHTPRSARARPTARTPRNLASTVAAPSKALAEARRQRRTASAGAPSSRQLSERFDELTGFYAKQKQEAQVGEHPRTPRNGASTRPSSGAAAARTPTSDKEPTPAAATPRPSTPPPPPPHPASHAAAAPLSASAVDVSALTVDSQAMRSAVTAATTSARRQAEEGRTARSKPPGASPVPWSTSPPQRSGLPATPPQRADDAVLRSTVSSIAGGVVLDKEPQPSPTPPPQPQPGSAETSDLSSLTSEHFTVQARQLRESLLHIKELLEQSEMAESHAELPRAAAADTDLDELASLLTTVAAQLHQRQVRRSAESA